MMIVTTMMMMMMMTMVTMMMLRRMGLNMMMITMEARPILLNIRAGIRADGNLLLKL